MAEQKNILQREYIIPLRKEWMKAPRYKRTRKSVKAIKEFVAKHMKVPDRDVNKVKLDVYLNNEMWFRGSRKPPAKVKVLVKREGDIVKVMMADAPERIKFLKARHDKVHKKSDKKAVEKKEEKKDGLEEKVEDVKKEEEKEKAKSVEEAQIKTAEKMAKQQKHTIGQKPSKAPLQRKALQK